MKRHIPNILTSMNLLCGTIATVVALYGDIKLAIVLVITGAIFDFFDGFSARVLGVTTTIGKELDSLADLITFGFAPSAMLSTYIKFTFTGSWIGNLFGPKSTPVAIIFSLLPFILVVFSAIRLAKFNVDTRQSENFLGLTTTATGMLVASFMWLIGRFNTLISFFRPTVVIFMVMIFCILLISEVPMISLKFKHFMWRGNELRYILLVLALLSMLILELGGIAVTIAIYICFSVIRYLIK